MIITVWLAAISTPIIINCESLEKAEEMMTGIQYLMNAGNGILAISDPNGVKQLIKASAIVAVDRI